MPSRMLHEKVCVSTTLAELTAEEERFFFRLIVKCDDHGRYHAHPSILLGALFSLQLDRISVEMVRAWLDRLEDVGLLQTYVADGREYLVILSWSEYQRQRGNKPKFPDPPQSAADCGELSQDAARASSRPTPGTLSGDSIRGLTPEDGAAAPPAASAETSAVEVPETLASFHAVLSEARGYAPSATFFEAVRDRYGSLDLREQALKIVSWLGEPKAKNRRQLASQRFILDWLKRESIGPPSRAPTRNGSGAHQPGIERMPVVVRRY